MNSPARPNAVYLGLEFASAPGGKGRPTKERPRLSQLVRGERAAVSHRRTRGSYGCKALRMTEEWRDAMRIVELGFPGELRDRLVAAVLSGEKTATTGLLVEWELDSEPVPGAGERFLVVDSAELPVAVIEFVDVRVVSLADVDIDTAKAEGEGFASVEEWRLAHEAFWNGYADDLRARLGDQSWRLADDTLVVVERFRLVDLLAQ
jgi:uncharacterized protein YhfF